MSIWSALNSPTIAPLYMTKIRSHSTRISSKSSEISKIAAPRCFCSISFWWMYSVAPTSMPRVGWAAMTTSGCCESVRATITFWMLPPESLRTASRGAALI